MINIPHRVIYTNKEIKQQIKRVAKEINKDYANKSPIVIGVLKGCIPFYNELFLQLTCDPVMDFMIISSFNGFKSNGVKIIADLRQDIQERDIIIVEDIVDSGRSIKKLIDVLKTRNFKSLKVACLINRANKKSFIFKPDYTCFHTEFTKNEYLIGFGLDYCEHYRNLPYITTISKKDKKLHADNQ